MNVPFLTDTSGQLSADTGFYMIPVALEKPRMLEVTFSGQSVMTTNDASNHWRFRMQKDGGFGFTVEMLTSSAGPDAEFFFLSNYPQDLSSATWVRCDLFKVGAPGNIVNPNVAIYLY